MLFRRKIKSTDDHGTTADGLRTALQRWATSQTRTAWRPIVTAGEPESSISKFCGASVTRAGESVPICKLCGRALQLFVQLDLAALPTGEFGSGVLQLFYCIGQSPHQEPDGYPDCWAEGAWVPFSDEASLVRVVAADSLSSPSSSNDSTVPAQSIVGWDPFDDVPDPEDHASCGLDRKYDFTLRMVTLSCPSVGVESTVGIDELQVEDIASAAEQDKLGGWPRWIQGAEYPSCPTCDTRMRLVFQLDSEDHVPYMFGDSGIGHITQCPTHHDVVAFGWACG